MKSYRNKLINLFTSPVANRRQLERQTIEYWSKREPYRSSGRAFGHIELINPVETPEGSYLVIRGWIFDTLSKIKDLRIFNLLGDTGTTIASLTRNDVVLNMRSYPHSRASGFLSLLPLRHAADELQLRASYHVSGEQINAVFENTPVSLGVANPGETIRPSRIHLSRDKNYVAVVLLPKWTPAASVIEFILKEQGALSTDVVVFSDMPKQQLDGLSSETTWHQRADAGLDDIAGTLLKFPKTLSGITLVGSLASDIVREQLLSTLAHYPIPPITWITTTAGKGAIIPSIPQELRGNLLETVVSDPSDYKHSSWRY